MQLGYLAGVPCGYVSVDAGGGGAGDDPGHGRWEVVPERALVASLVDVGGEGVDRGEVVLVGLGAGGEHLDDRHPRALGAVGDRGQQRIERAADPLWPGAGLLGARERGGNASARAAAQVP